MTAIGVDVGGTFTDVVLIDADGQIDVAKVVTTPDDPRRGVRHGVEVALARRGIPGAQVTRFVHGTTLATNVLLQRQGARSAFVTTAGFGDMLRLGREHRVGPARYDLLFPPADPPVDYELTFEVHERLGADGSVRVALDRAEIDRLVERLVPAKPDAVAICFLHSYINGAHERAVARAIRDALPHAFVVASCDIWPEMREHERASTAVACAYVGPIMAAYLSGLQAMLADLGVTCPIQVMDSGGGVLSAALAAERPVATIESGGAAGVMAAGFLGGLAGARDVLSFDMGGTTAKTAVLRDGQPTLTYEFRVGESASYGDRRGAGLAVKTPVVDMAEVGAGGGSIAWVDDGGALRVGPQSAGAVPGPACYGRGGTRPTVTDANLVLGYLSTGELSDAVTVSLDLAHAAIDEHVAAPLGLPVVEAAHAIHEIVNANMAAAIRMVTIQRGIDPRDFTLVGFGGAGPIHLARLAEPFGIEHAIVPWAAGVASAVGLVAADPTVTEIRSDVLDAASADPQVVNAHFAELEARAVLALECEHRDATFHRTIDARYRGQIHQLPVPVAATPLSADDLARAAERFHSLYHATYGVDARGPVEFVTYKVRAVRAVEKPRPHTDPSIAAGRATPTGERDAYFHDSGGFVRTPIYDWAALPAGAALEGPAIIEGAATLITVPPGWRASVDPTRNVNLHGHTR